MKQRNDWHVTEALHAFNGRGNPFAAVVRATRMPMIVTDPSLDDNPIVFANDAFLTLTGYACDEVAGRNCRFLQGPKTNKADIQKLREAIKRGESIELELLNYRKDGSTFWNALYLSPVKDEHNNVNFFVASQVDVTESVEAQKTLRKKQHLIEQEVKARTIALQEAVEAKTLLLHEVDHRVKNNLAMIGSLIRMQLSKIGDEKFKTSIETMLGRVDALSLIHRRLYQSEDILQFDIGQFIVSLASEIVMATGRSDISVQSAVESISIPSVKAGPLGLLLNEIITNAIKHAYGDGRGGTLKLLANRNNSTANIEIIDDGPGINLNSPQGTGLGFKLINRLSRQVEADVRWNNNKPGTRVLLTLELS